MQIIAFLQNWHWWSPLVGVPLFLVLIHLGLNLLYKHLYPKQVAKENIWGALVLKALNQPFKLLLWFSGLSILVTLYAHICFDLGIVNMIAKLLKVGVIVALAWALYIFTEEGEKALLLKKNYDITTVELFSKLSLVAIGICTLLLILPLFGIQIAGLLAFGGFSGLIVGMAAKDAIANILGGFIIAIDKPFKIGDWVYSHDNAVEGIVEHIGWRLTKIRTFEKRPTYVPNSLFSTLMITNASRMSHRRILTKVGVRYQDIDKLNAIVAAIEEYIKTSPDIDHKQSNYVALVEFNESTLDIEMRFYTKATATKEYYEARQKILIDVYQMIRREGAEVPFPIQTVLLEKCKEEMRI